MEFLVDILLTPLGWLALHLRFRDKKRRLSSLKSDYDNSYANVARHYIFTSILLLVGCAIVLLIVGTVIVPLISRH